jgi:pyruvate, water dikinase
MSLLDFLRRKVFYILHKRANTAPRLKEIWSGFQQILASNNEIQGIIGGLEEMLSGLKDPDLPFLNSRVWVLDQHFAGLVAALQTISGGKYAELEEARVRIHAAIQQRLEAAAAADPPDPALLRAVTELIIPLNLVDRRSPTFKPENCRTYNDITRFAHEKAIQVMFGLMDDVAQGRVPALKLLKLKTALPLNLHLVDLGDGLASHNTPVPPEDILSRPMRALWQGMSYPGIAWAGPVPVDVGGFLQVLGQSAINPPEKFWDKTYAIVAANYVNYACRLGYHFQSVDSYIGDASSDNYINFTFKGGAADDVRRIRRIRLIAIVLERLGFTMEIFGDVIRARFRRHPALETEERLHLVGRLMAYVRQMDMLMKDDNISQVLAERFLTGHYERPGEEEDTGDTGDTASQR